MAIPRRSFSCTVGLHELENSTFPSLSRCWPATTLATATERTINDAATWLRMFMSSLLFEAIRAAILAAHSPSRQYLGRIALRFDQEAARSGSCISASASQQGPQAGPNVARPGARCAGPSLLSAAPSRDSPELVGLDRRRPLEVGRCLVEPAARRTADCLVQPVSVFVDVERHLPVASGKWAHSASTMIWCASTTGKEWWAGTGLNRRHQDFQARCLVCVRPREALPQKGDLVPGSCAGV